MPAKSQQEEVYLQYHNTCSRENMQLFKEILFRTNSTNLVALSIFSITKFLKAP